MLLAGPVSHTSTQYIDFVDFLHFNGSVYRVLSFLCVTILECCVTFSGVKLSIRSFVLFKLLPLSSVVFIMSGSSLTLISHLFLILENFQNTYLTLNILRT